MLMTCRHVRQLHDAYLDGELSASLMAEMHAHLLQCPACQREIEMSRACETVIATDQTTDSQLDSGFASRVVASLQKSGMITASPALPGLETRRVRRNRLWRVGISAALPAAAAVLFFSILIWPPVQPDETPRIVAGMAVEAIGAERIVQPALGAVVDTKDATNHLNRLITIAGNDARQDVETKLQKAKKTSSSAWDLIFQEPFNGILDGAQAEPSQSADKNIVRF